MGTIEEISLNKEVEKLLKDRDDLWHMIAEQSKKIESMEERIKKIEDGN